MVLLEFYSREQSQHLLDIAEGHEIDPEFEKMMRKRARNSIRRAMRERPKIIVRRLLWLRGDGVLRHYYYKVNRFEKDGSPHSEHTVLLRNDRDDTWFGDCDCLAGNPPRDYTGVIEWQPKPCVHLASVLLVFIRTMKAAQVRLARLKLDKQKGKKGAKKRRPKKRSKKTSRSNAGRLPATARQTQTQRH